MQILFLVGSLLGAATLAACQVANATTGELGDARPVRNNPVIGERWVAIFNSSTVKGIVTATAHTVGINYAIDVTGLTAEKGPYSKLPRWLIYPLHAHMVLIRVPRPCAGRPRERRLHRDWRPP